MKVEEYLKNYIKSKSSLEHAFCVKNLSLKIYDDLKKIFPDNHLLDFENAHKLIEASALLHDIGTFFGGVTALKPHNKTGAKLVFENKIDGFEENELKVVCASIRYHRGSKPKEGKHRLFSSLEQKDKNKVLVISSVLRLSDALDKLHMQSVRDIILTYDFDSSALTLNPGINIMFNRGIKRVFNKKKTLFEEVFKLKICLKNDRI